MGCPTRWTESFNNEALVSQDYARKGFVVIPAFHPWMPWLAIPPPTSGMLLDQLIVSWTWAEFIILCQVSVHCVGWIYVYGKLYNSLWSKMKARHRWEPWKLHIQLSWNNKSKETWFPGLNPKLSTWEINCCPVLDIISSLEKSIRTLIFGMLLSIWKVCSFYFQTRNSINVVVSDSLGKTK